MENTGYYTKLPGGNSQEGDEGLLHRGKMLKWGISETQTDTLDASSQLCMTCRGLLPRTS